MSISEPSMIQARKNRSALLPKIRMLSSIIMFSESNVIIWKVVKKARVKELKLWRAMYT